MKGFKAKEANLSGQADVFGGGSDCSPGFFLCILVSYAGNRDIILISITTVRRPKEYWK